MPRQTSIIASAIIPAPPDRVWAIACDPSRYPEWVENPLRMSRTDGPARAGATMEELTRIAGPWKSVTRWRVTEFDPPRRQVQQGQGVSTAKNMAVIIELRPPARTPISPSPSAIRRGSGRSARSSTGPSEVPLPVLSRDRRGRSPRLSPVRAQVPEPAVAASRRTGTRGDSQPAGLLATGQAVGYARCVHHDSEQSRHSCAAPPRRTRQQHASAESAIRRWDGTAAR